MRFLFYDKIVKIEKEHSIRGIKSFSLSEEFLRNHFTKTARVPGVIYIEAMAQLLGWLIIYSHDFKLSAIMTLIGDVDLPQSLRPGFKADIYGEIISTSRSDSLGRAWIEVDGDVIASMKRIIFSHFHKIDSQELAKLFYYYSGIEETAETK